MFFSQQPKSNIEEYYNLLKIVGSLSNLFSDSATPYLYYRAAENIFCKAFEADNLSRSDCSADASKQAVGIGLKTYLNNSGNTFQKIAEFNRDRNNYHELIKDPAGLVRYISSLRNKRLESTQVIHSLDNLIYHCVTRQKNNFLLFEERMDYINIDRIKDIIVRGNSISFNDKTHSYSFNLSKSTLFKKFETKNPISVKVDILEDPYETLRKIFEDYKLNFVRTDKSLEFVILPLYSAQSHKVEVSSGLNQWNADGRKRDQNEVYIPVPAVIHRYFPDFFPENKADIKFNLNLPNGKQLSAKMCQTYKTNINGKIVNKGKGLMSNPNKDLGEWILRDILKIPEGKLVTYEMLEEIGIDSIEIRKIDLENYEIDFKELGSFEEFIRQHQP